MHTPAVAARREVPRTSILAALAAGLLLAAAAPLPASGDEFPDRWRTLYPTARRRTPLRPLPDLAFTGPHANHPHYLGLFEASGSWDAVDKLLVPSGEAALELGTAVDFEIEGVADASGTGGLFLLVGRTDTGGGYGLWNATLRESGSPWGAFRLEDNAAAEGSAEDLPMYEWKGERPFRLSVRGGRLSLRVGTQSVVADRPLPGYEGGAIIVGTYAGRYGPRALKVRSLRARSLPPETPVDASPGSAGTIDKSPPGDK